MHILLYDKSLFYNSYDPAAILFYINNVYKQVHCYHTWNSTLNFFAQLEQNGVRRGRLVLEDNVQHYCSSFFANPDFLTMFDRKPIQVSQTVLITPTCERIADDAKMKEILNVYNVSEEIDLDFNVHDTIEVMNQCNDSDTLRLYMLFALPYLNNCCISDIVQFADSYNSKLWDLLILKH